MAGVACDCLILGGGPAGAALAILLRLRGRTVVLVDHGRLHPSGPNETLLAASVPLLERCGLLPSVAAAAHRDELRHGSIWGQPETVWQQGGEAGLRLVRGTFDRSLRAQAAGVGVDVRCPAQVVRRPTGEVEVRRADGTGTVLLPRTFVLATGRAHVAGFAGPAAVAGPPTHAFTFVGIGDAADRRTAIVEAVPGGWIWTHVLPAGEASATVLVDAAPGVDPAGARRRAVQAATGPTRRMRDLRLLFANDATARVRSATGELLRIGDAAATIDPLASQGVEKALAAAEHASVVVAAALQRPEWWPRLCALHAQWEAGLFAAHRRAAAAFYRQETRFAAEPFWQARREWADETPVAAVGEYVVAPQVGITPVLVRQGSAIEEREGACDARSGQSLSHVGYVPVVPLLQCFRQPLRLGEAVARAGQDARLFVLPPRAVHAALQELVRRGWLIPAATATDNR